MSDGDGRPRGRLQELAEALRSALAEADSAASSAKKKSGKRSKHYPFAGKTLLGPGPRGRTVAKQDVWACKCNDYVCTCKSKKGKRRQKKVVIDRGYKRTYNAQYKAWRKNKA